MPTIQLTKEQTEALRGAKAPVAFQDADGRPVGEMDLQEYRVLQDYLAHRNDPQDDEEYCSGEAVHDMLLRLEAAVEASGELSDEEFRAIVNATPSEKANARVYSVLEQKVYEHSR